MSELIDREATVKQICKMGEMLGGHPRDVVIAIALFVQDDKTSFPTITIPVAELDTTEDFGEWVEVPKYKGFYVCSKCLERLDGDFGRFDHWEMKKKIFALSAVQITERGVKRNEQTTNQGI